MMRLLRAIFGIFDKIHTANNIRQDPARRARSALFGVQSAVCSLFAVPVCALMIVFPLMLNGEGALLAIFGIALFALGIVGALVLLAQALLYWILQISLNRRVITWIALVLLLASIAGCALVAVYAVGLF